MKTMNLKLMLVLAVAAVMSASCGKKNPTPPGGPIGGPTGGGGIGPGTPTSPACNIPPGASPVVASDDLDTEVNMYMVPDWFALPVQTQARLKITTRDTVNAQGHIIPNSKVIHGFLTIDPNAFMVNFYNSPFNFALAPQIHCFNSIQETGINYGASAYPEGGTSYVLSGFAFTEPLKGLATPPGYPSVSNQKLILKFNASMWGMNVPSFSNRAFNHDGHIEIFYGAATTGNYNQGFQGAQRTLWYTDAN